MENSKELPFQFGPIVLFGSGETMPASGKAYELVAKIIGSPLHISILETPAGFQPNTKIVARKVGDYISKRLQNYNPTINLIPARNIRSNQSPNNKEIVDEMLLSNWIFMGPGSPTYTIRQLENSLTLNYLYALHQTGSALTLSSAGVLAMSTLTLPVYEIYKVGEDLHWVKGLNFFSRFGCEMVLIPHWNNNDGGAELDTSRCFIGMERFNAMRDILPEALPIIGIDEQTALIIQFDRSPVLVVSGKGSVTTIIGREEKVFPPGKYSPGEFGIDINLPNRNEDHFPGITEKIKDIRVQNKKSPDTIVIDLANKRLQARKNGNWDAADDLRVKIEAQGWIIQDTPDSFTLFPKNP